MIEILPCPFCGSKDIEIQPVFDDKGHCVHCFDCDSWGPVSDTIDNTIAAWNHRSKPTDVEEV